jgi:hypothetical protein
VWQANASKSYLQSNTLANRSDGKNCNAWLSNAANYQRNIIPAWMKAKSFEHHEDEASKNELEGNDKAQEAQNEPNVIDSRAHGIVRSLRGNPQSTIDYH